MAQDGGRGGPAKDEEEGLCFLASLSTPRSLAELATLASQRYVELYSTETLRAYPENVRDVLLRVMNKDEQITKLGEYKAWTQEGRMWCHERYGPDHRPRGLAQWWHPDNGTKWREEYYDEQGRKHGVQRWWHPNGQLRTEARYEEGREMSYQAWTLSGKPM